MTDAIKTCWRCGVSASVEWYRDDYGEYVFVRCDECAARSFDTNDEQEVIAWWNTRHEPKPSVEREVIDGLSELVQEVKECNQPQWIDKPDGPGWWWVRHGNDMGCMEVEQLPMSDQLIVGEWFFSGDDEFVDDVVRERPDARWCRAVVPEVPDE